ncbi:MAG: RnfABCDGE type electron transport complex subunit G [Pseudomonadota bacterium]
MSDQTSRRPGVIAGTVKLTLFALVAATIVAAAWQVTRERIATNRHAAKIALFEPVLAGVAFDAVDYANPSRLSPPHDLPGNEAALIYTVSDKNAREVARVYEVSAKGYSGPIRLLIGIDTTSTLTGVRVIAHTETPGLGDWIETSRSDWIDTFTGRSLANTPKDGWRLQKEGGEFAAFTGASITPRAVVNAVKQTLEYDARQRL